MPSPILPLKLRELNKLWWTSKVGKIETSLGGSKWFRLPRFSSRYGQQTSPKPLFLDGAWIFFWLFMGFFRETMVFFTCPGVDDLYTDPQIHTASSGTTRFGRGNMGLRGMALFFASHRCWVQTGHGKLGPEREPKKRPTSPGDIPWL